MGMPRFVGLFAALVLGAALAALPAAASAAPADPAWTDDQSQCTTAGDAGQVCLIMQQQVVSATETDYRIGLTVTPTAGHWIQATSWGGGEPEEGTGGPWCESSPGVPTDCPQVTSTWSSAWFQANGHWVYVADYATDTGADFHTALGDTGWLTMASQCSAPDAAGTACTAVPERGYAYADGTAVAWPYAGLFSTSPVSGQSITPLVGTIAVDSTVASQNFCATTCPDGSTPFSTRVQLAQDPTTFNQEQAAFTYTDSAGHTDTITATF
jgi:hypothetical protein